MYGGLYDEPRPKLRDRDGAMGEWKPMRFLKRCRREMSLIRILLYLLLGECAVLVDGDVEH
jgi:hypothetical protein